MANKPVKKNLSALKRMRQSEKRHERNQAVKSAVKTMTKKFNEVLRGGNEEEIQKVYRDIIKLLDKASSKNILHRNNSSRRISTISRKLHKYLSGKAA
ncbi:30S ribosomal protein S20 [bacterium BMS3Abin07]|nr:30S ribosomal protein S20 [bacterium BMS3Abin07]GBE31815.1 30S ribosomal protein S20 [bacterium BMS3Bbin05]HDL19951.1 30S ribosomal protein S20 [Nitrospirota bacterium]HDO21406.1 30S ribosomal protein S20 [Nitrospirota bacterium]HDZ87467.1 30S ribosomal protein S20 [Nitrospirota bacterium]